MQREVRWEKMFPDELDAVLAETPVVYVPLGLCEPHGPQNALGQDALRAHGFSCHAARKYGGIVAPPHFWHVHEVGIYAAWAEPLIGQQRPWATALPPWMFFKNLCYQIRTMDWLGFEAIVVFSGHGGPHSQDVHIIQEVLQRHLAARLEIIVDGHGPWWEGSAHGGAVETAMLWALRPDCVDLSRLPAPEAPGPHFAMGVDAREASLRRGGEIVEQVADMLGATGVRLREDYARLQPERRPLSFAQVEKIWREEIEPRVPDFACMQDLAGSQAAPAEDSQWRLNWHISQTE